MTVMQRLSDNAPVMIAWKRHKESEDYRDSKHWADQGAPHAEGSLWGCFYAGFLACAIMEAQKVSDAQTDEVSPTDAAELAAARAEVERLTETLKTLQSLLAGQTGPVGASLRAIIRSALSDSAASGEGENG